MILNLDPSLYQKLLSYPSLWVGLSGGLDSVVLLQLLSCYPELKSRLHAIHIHHGLSPHADTWALFCEQYCRDQGIPFTLEKVKLMSAQNLEASARALRYQAFQQHLPAQSALCLGHHLDDNIETFFLQALRGTGIKGLAGIDAFRPHADMDIYRPLLDYPREAIMAYAKALDLSWVEDESNDDTHIFRNYLRHEILPRIEKKWPYYRQSLQHTMHTCRDLVQELEPKQTFTSYLDLQHYPDMSDFNWQQLLRAWIKANTMHYPSQKILRQICQQMIHAKRCDSEAMIHLGAYRLIAYRRVLEIFLNTPLLEDIVWHNFPEPFLLHGYGEIALSAALIAEFEVKASDKVEICFRRGGEKIKQKNGHLSLKKQFQALGVAPYKRTRIPLLYINDELRYVFFKSFTQSPIAK